jgi:dihydrofolate reductase
MISIISAFDPNKTIGFNNNLPWKIKEDLKLFKELTEKNIVIMGRNTYESIGKPLPNRMNIIITSKVIQNNNLLYTFSSFEDCIKYCKKINLNKNIFVIGGRKLYKYCLDNKLIDKMFISKIKKVYEGDVKFPDFKEEDWDKNLKSSYEEFDLWIYTKK